MNPQSTSRLDSDPLFSTVRKLIAQGEFNSTIVSRLESEHNYKTTSDSIRRFRKRHQLGIPTREKAGVEIKGDEATVTTPVTMSDRINSGQVDHSTQSYAYEGISSVTIEDTKGGGTTKSVDQAPVDQRANHYTDPLEDTYPSTPGSFGIPGVNSNAYGTHRLHRSTFDVLPESEREVEDRLRAEQGLDPIQIAAGIEPTPAPGITEDPVEENPVAKALETQKELADSILAARGEDTSPTARLNDPDSMLIERGLNPEEWEIRGATVNEWEGLGPEGTKVLNHQAKLQLVKKRSAGGLLPARADGWKPATRSLDLEEKGYKTIVLVGDQQAPFQDERLHNAFLEWLFYNQPDEGILIGDTVDFPDISRHRNNPDNVATANQCIQAGYEILRDYVKESEGTQWTKLIGNHDERIRNFVIDNASPLHGLQRATRSYADPDEKVLEIAYLLRLDELGITLIDPKGGYAQAQANVGESLAVRHGWLTRKGAGATALASLEAVGYNIVVGHTHRQGLVQKTTHDINNKPKTLYGVEAGCMCSIDGAEVDGRRFPDYTTNPDWQQGFAVATVYDDGQTNIELATFREGQLYFRNQRYS